MAKKEMLNEEQRSEILAILEERFKANMTRHPGVDWESVREKLTEGSLWSLYQMEQSGGEPDVVVFDDPTGKYRFVDCSPESPAGRRNLCYDDKALESRKKNKPSGSAIGEAACMGVTLLTEEEYRILQEVGKFDQVTSSWIQTPEKIRGKGGALFCDRRFDHVFTYHNGAESYYAARGFRASLLI